MWEQARIWFYQMMAHLDPISLGFYVLFFFAVIGTMLLVDGRIKFVPNDRWRFGDKLK